MEELYAGCYQDRLDQGLKVIFEPRPDRPLSLGIWARLGSRDESAPQAGISHFLEHMVFKGTRRRTAFQISEEVDSIGGSINAMTSREYTAFHVDALPEHLDRALDVLSDLVQNPLFRSEDVAREKGVILEEIRLQEDTPHDIVVERFNRQLWDTEHPLARPITGFAHTVGDFGREDLLDRFSLYDSHQLFLVAAGGVGAEGLRRAAEEQLGGLQWKNGARPERAVPRPHGGFHLEDRPLQQAHLCFGTPGFSKDDARRYALEVMNVILGGGMSSRLFKRIREELGLAYAVFSHANYYSDSGAFAIYAGTDPDHAGQALEVCWSEIERLQREPVPPETLQLAQEKIKGNIVLGLDGSHARMIRHGIGEIHGKHIPVDEVIARVEAVTAEDIQAVARDLFGEQAPFTLSAVGPGEKLDSLGRALPVSLAAT